MVNKKILLLNIFVIAIALSMLSGTNALPQNSIKQQGAAGAGIFIHEHDSQPHNHYFTLTVSNGEAGTDGWLNNPSGKFYLVAIHNKEVHMIVLSNQIMKFKITENEGSLSIVFEGTAKVYHPDEGWQSGWQLEVEAIDKSPQGTGEDSIHVMLTAPSGQEHHMEGILTSGNIVIKG